MPSPNTVSSLHQLSTICDDNLSLHAKIGLITVSKPYPSPIIEKILLSLEFLQLFTPLLMSAVSFKHSQEVWLPDTLLFIAKLLNPGYWISFLQINLFNVTVLSLIFAFIVSKMLLYFYIAYKLSQNSPPSETMIKIWRIIFRFQGKITYFYLTSFFVNALTASEDHHHNKLFIMASIALISLEFSFSMFITISYKYLLPTKSFLSAKNNQLEIIILLQKFILQLLLIFLPSHTWTWVFPIFNLLCDRTRQVCFLKTLPLYKFQALQFQGHLLVLLSSFNLSCLTLAIVKSVDQNSSSLLALIVLWLMFSLLFFKLCQEVLRNAFFKIVADSSVTCPDILIHRIPLIKQLIRRNSEESLDENQNSKWTLLLYQSLNKNLSSILKINTANISLKSKASVNQLFKQYLEKLLEMYPKDQLIKLYAAKFFAKKFNMYGEPVKMAKYIKKHGTFLMTLQAEYILMEIQNQIQKQAQQNQFNPFKYIQEQSFLAQLKLQILKQANLQIDIYSELKKTTPNLTNVLENSQRLKERRDKTTIEITQATQKTSESHIEPFLLFAQYHLILNQSISDYLAFAKIYTRKFQKYFKAFEEETLSCKNLFQNTTGFYFLSGQKADVGTILLTSKNQLPNSKGIKIHHISQKIAPCLRSFYDTFYKNLAEETDSPHFNKIMRGFAYDEGGCLTETDYCFNIHPHVTQGFYFTLLFRPVISNRDAFYVLENGDIDCSTKKIRNQLGLDYGHGRQEYINIRDISEELAIANNVFNIIAFPERFSNDLTEEDINNIYTTYTTQGKTLLLNSFSKKSQLTYHCRIQNRILDTMVVKTMTFEQVTMTKKPQSPLPTPPPKKESSEELSFSFDEEKDRGWLLNFQPPHNYRTLTQRNLHTDPQENITTTRTLLDSSSSRIQLNPDKSPKIQAKNKTPTLNTPTSPPYPQETDIQHPNYHAQSLTGRSPSSSQLSQRKKLSNIFKKSLETQYSSKISRILISIFYLTLILLITSQIILSSALNTNTTQLQSKKDVLRNFQSRNCLTITIGGSLRALQEVNNGQFNTTGLFLFMGGTQMLRGIASQILSQLSGLNQYLLHNADNIEENVRNLLFEQNIRIYDTYFNEPVQSYLDLSTLQATDKIIETGLMLMNTQDMATPQAIQAANFFFRNTANDLIIQNQKIASLLTDLFMSQREKIEKIISVYLYLLTGILMSILMVFGFLMRKQYLKEKKNLLALCQLSNKQIDNVMKSCVKFKEEIEDQKSFVESHCFTLKDEEKKITRQKSTRKTPNLKGIQRKYYIYYGKLLVIISLLIALIISSSIIAEQTIDNLKAEQEQIGFVDYLQTRTSLSMQAYGELLATNNIALIENNLASEELTKLGEELQTVRRDIYRVLLAKDIAEHGKTSKAFFLDEACDLLDPVLTAYACEILRASGKKTGMIYLFNDLQDLITDHLEHYAMSDKSEKSRMEIKRSDYNELVAIYQVLMNGQESLGNLINERLEREIKKSRKMREQILGIFVGVGVILGCLSWVCLLRKLKKGVSEFKNVLKMFPAEVIFSSFLLRSFLVKTSKNKIDYIKN